ncbi:peptidyl-prolyl cis-trans isomerase FKBP7 precursor [Callorhinchus milii]|uniref:peptidylprolyl isomerase n=1 Tax=Callorhinchus milii TaxID=7868 RepID=K4FTD0_CALMI|nr:peptidyl-prolyl cis-trans isomerase FKBP7 precursor [Callorhinchus milii]AFK11025.1 peptidyl-prolyl cis-trans isomerase FKBP7-like protein [Callorhinchus milii]
MGSLCALVVLSQVLWCLEPVRAATGGEEDLSGVKIEVIYKPEQCGQRAKRGDLLSTYFDGYLAVDGTQIYCSRVENQGQPKWFVLGVGQVIKGLDIGMRDMCEGEKRKLTVPPLLAYGKMGRDKVPPDATLIFDVELYKVERGPRSPEGFRAIDLNNDRKLSPDELKMYLQNEFKNDEKRRDDSIYLELVLADILQRNDHDGNGFISAREYNIYHHDEL